MPKKTAGSPGPMPVDRWELFALAAAAKVDPRTIRNYLTGAKPVRSVPVREVVERTLREHGHGSLVRVGV